MQLDADFEVAEGLDGLVEADLAAVDLEALGGELDRDVRRGDRAEEVAVFARLAGEDEHDGGELGPYTSITISVLLIV